jgi:hypothetical protein
MERFSTGKFLTMSSDEGKTRVRLVDSDVTWIRERFPEVILGKLVTSLIHEFRYITEENEHATLQEVLNIIHERLA